VLLLWSHAEFPTGPGLSVLPGRPVVIDGRPAKVYAGPAMSECPAGASTEISAAILEAVHGHPGQRFQLTACLGPQASAGDRRDISTMLATLHIKR
jgi:hypothetical protein